MLEAIKSGGAIQRFANGGAVGSGMGFGGTATGAAPAIQVNLDLCCVSGNEEIRRIAQEAASKRVYMGLRQYDRVTLPQSVARVRQDPRLRG